MVSPTTVFGRTGYLHANEWNWTLILHTKINSKWFKDLNVSEKAVTLLEENTVVHFYDLRFGNRFLGMTSKTHVTKEK